MELWMLALVPIMPVLAGVLYGFYLRTKQPEVTTNE